MANPDPRSLLDSSDDRLFVSHGHMREHLAAGRAVPLSRLITDQVRYDGSWWLADQEGWHPVTDDVLAAKLDNFHAWADGNLYLGGRGS
jgi:hypothetical protein